MALETVNLDDLNWREMVTATQGRIIANSSNEWTLHSPVDPGVTIYELFSYLLEQRLFWLDQIPDSLSRGMLDLLGEKPLPTQIASTIIQFKLQDFTNYPNSYIPLPDKTELRLSNSIKPIIFTTQDEVTLLPLGKSNIAIYVSDTDRTGDLKSGVEVFAGGREWDEFKVVFFLKNLVPSTTPTKGWITILFALNIPSKIEPEWSNQAEKNYDLFDGLTWWFSSAPNGSPKKFDTEDVKDGTCGFRRSGIVRIKFPENWHHIDVQNDRGEWPYAIWVRNEHATFVYPPVLVSIESNVVVAKHVRDAHSSNEYFEKQIEKWRPLPGQILKLPEDQIPPIEDVFKNKENLEKNMSKQRAKIKPISLHLKERDGKWHSWSATQDFSFHGPTDRIFKVDRNKGELVFGDGLTGRLPIPGFWLLIPKEVIDLNHFILLLKQPPDPIMDFLHDHLSDDTIDLLENFEEDHSFTKTLTDKLINDINSLMIKKSLYTEGRFSQVNLGESVRDLIAENPKGKQLVKLNRLLLEAAYPELIKPAPQIHIHIAHQVGGGEIGNTGDSLAWEFSKFSQEKLGEKIKGIHAVNIVPATGGSEPESILNAKERVGASFKKRYRAVTKKDMEQLAIATPSISIQRAYAAIGHHPSHPCSKVQGAVTIFVVPFAPRESNYILTQEDRNYVVAPQPDEKTLALVRQFFSNKRLLSSQIFICGPAYRTVTVSVEALGSPLDSELFRKGVGSALAKYLDPLIGGDEGSGWPFGYSLRPSALLRQIQNEMGNEADIIKVTIGIDEAPPNEDCADIDIEAHELVYLKSFNVNLKSNSMMVGGLR